MARPQQPELARSAKTDLDPDHVETGLQGQPPPSSGGETGPVPVDNQPGHHPAKEQDKPDLDAFAARLGTDPTAPSATDARKPPRRKATPAEAPSGPASRPAAISEREPAPPPKIQTTPANRPAAAPGWPESAPAPDDLGPLPDPPGDLRRRPDTAGAPGPGPRPDTPGTPGPGRQPDAVGMSAPQPQPDGQPEARLVGLVLLPLRETVKRLEQLDRSLTERLARSRLSARGSLGPRGR